MKKVHYIGWYITDKEWGQYKGNVPGMMKMRYVADQLKKTTDNLHILSFADKQDRPLYGMKDIVNDGMTIHYTGGCKNSGKIGRYINTLIKKYTLFCILSLVFLIKTSLYYIIVMHTLSSLLS